MILTTHFVLGRRKYNIFKSAKAKSLQKHSENFTESVLEQSCTVISKKLINCAEENVSVRFTVHLLHKNIKFMASKLKTIQITSKSNSTKFWKVYVTVLSWI